jgi:hypothetical protein
MKSKERSYPYTQQPANNPHCSHPISWRLISISSYHLLPGLPSGRFTSDCPPRALYVFLCSPKVSNFVPPPNFTLFDFDFTKRSNWQKNWSISFGFVTRTTRFVTRTTLFVTRTTLFVTRTKLFVTRTTLFVTRTTLFVTRTTLFVTRTALFVAYLSTNSRRQAVVVVVVVLLFKHITERNVY